MISTKMSVAIVTKDVKQSRAFYEKLGFLSDGEDHWITVRPKGAEWRIHLCQSDRHEPEKGNTGIALYCDDLESTFRQLKAKGVTFSSDEIIKAPWGEYAMIKDPDENEVWLMAGEP
ncbi:MAG: VOC family protein [Nitrososphaerota archaeon]|nr:VOC family protein [Nitrososphaerota archaeon]MDG7041235.1 VOC family protein [Nitrososphaerota archaeon]MDG7047076.1 VOC family protein [Nitrososphaerota archaeon]